MATQILPAVQSTTTERRRGERRMSVAEIRRRRKLGQTPNRLPYGVQCRRVSDRRGSLASLVSQRNMLTAKIVSEVGIGDTAAFIAHPLFPRLAELSFRLELAVRS